jgi:hypothetical protein
VNFSDFGICKVIAVIIHTSLYLSLVPSFPVGDWECFPGGSTSHLNDISRTKRLETAFTQAKSFMKKLVVNLK